MRSASVAFAIAALVSAVAIGAAQDTKWVRGAITQVAADGVTVSVNGAPMKFSITKDTTIAVTGAGTAQRRTEAAGGAGVKADQVLKAGQRVEVEYHDMGGTLHAASIRSATGGDASSDQQGKTARGTVSAIDGSSLTVMSGGKDLKFALDDKTSVVARGAGTAAANAGGKVKITDQIGKGDEVIVKYHEMGSTLHAAEVRVQRKAAS